MMKAMSLYDPKDQVSKREFEVLELLSNGFSSPQIAGRLFISINTVKDHRKSLLRKLEAVNVAHLVRTAFESGIFQPRYVLSVFSAVGADV